VKFFYKLSKDVVLRANVIEKNLNLFDSGLLVMDNSEGKIKSKYAIDPKITYIMVKRSDNRKCRLHFTIFFEQMGLLPYRCLDCWKVVIRPRTLKETVELAEKIYDLGCPYKYGYDTREYTFGGYGIFIYNDSLEEAKDRYEKVLELGAPGGDRTWIQRGCTEMNHNFGSSSEWKLDEEDIKYQKWLEDTFYSEYSEPDQPEVVREFIFSRMVRWAYMIGDDTYKEFIEEELYPEVVRYDL